MKKILLLFLLALPSYAAAQTAGVGGVVYGDKEKYFSVNQFGGLNTDFSPIFLKDNETPDSENVITDLGPGLQPRAGFVSYSTESAKNIWQFSPPGSSGNKYQIIVTTSGVVKATAGGGIFSIKIATVSTSVTTVGTQLGNDFYFSNTVDGLQYWDTSSTVLISTSLNFSILTTHKDRLWGCGKTGAERTIYISEFGGATDFGTRLAAGTIFSLVVNPVDTDPAQIPVGGSLDENILGLTPFGDVIVWHKPHSFGEVAGSDRSDFEQRTVSNDVGTAYPETVKDCDGELRFMGPNRTIYAYDRAKYWRISDTIQNILKAVSQGDSNARSYNWDSQADFSQGQSLQVSTSVQAGTLQLSTWTATDTSDTDFAQGSGVNFDTNTVLGSVRLSYPDTDVLNSSFENGTDPNADNWTRFGGSWLKTTTALSYSGTACMVDITPGANSFYTLRILDINSNVLAAQSQIPTLNVWTLRSFPLGSYIGKILIISFVDKAGISYIKSDPFLCDGQDITWYDTQFGTGNNGIDLLSHGRSSNTEATFISRSFDTGFSSAAWLASNFFETENGNSVLVRTQTSSDSANWDTLQTWNNGSSPASGWNRYIRYRLDISTTVNSDGPPSFNAAVLSARASTGSWVSNSVPIGSQPSWGLFSENDNLNGGSSVYAFYTDSDSTKNIVNGVPVVGSYLSSQTITSGQIPSVSTAPYAFISSYFSITNSTQNPTLNSASIGWTEGSTIRASSAYYLQRYWLGVAVNSTTNNRVLVYDRNKNWQRYNGINADTLGIYNSNLYFGNTGGIYQAESGTSDNGAAISSYYRTKDYFPSSLDIYSTYQDLFVTSDNSNSTLSTSYQIDGNSTDNSLNSYLMNTQSGRQNVRIPFPSSQVTQGKTINLKFSVSSTSAWRFLNGTLGYISDVQPLP